MPMSPAALGVVLREVVRRNRVRWGIVYLQITRGVARRDHAFPPPGTRAERRRHRAQPRPRQRREDRRRRRRRRSRCRRTAGTRVDIKSVSLLPNVLAKQAAREQGAREAWFVDQRGLRHRRLVVQRLDRDPRRHGGHPPGRPRHPRGITRTVVLDVHRGAGAQARGAAFTLEEAQAAREAFITSASQIVMPVVKIDGRPVGNGAPGLIASALRRDFHRHAEIALNAGGQARSAEIARKSRVFVQARRRTWACAATRRAI